MDITLDFEENQESPTNLQNQVEIIRSSDEPYIFNPDRVSRYRVDPGTVRRFVIESESLLNHKLYFYCNVKDVFVTLSFSKSLIWSDNEMKLNSHSSFTTTADKEVIDISLDEWSLLLNKQAYLTVKNSSYLGIDINIWVSKFSLI